MSEHTTWCLSGAHVVETPDGERIAALEDALAAERARSALYRCRVRAVLRLARHEREQADKFAWLHQEEFDRWCETYGELRACQTELVRVRASWRARKQLAKQYRARLRQTEQGRAAVLATKLRVLSEFRLRLRTAWNTLNSWGKRSGGLGWQNSVSRLLGQSGGWSWPRSVSARRSPPLGRVCQPSRWQS